MDAREPDQPVGAPVVDWAPRRRPAATVLAGRFVRLEPLSQDHVRPLFEHLCGEQDQGLWTYRRDEAPASLAQMAQYVAALIASTHTTTYAVLPIGEGAAGQPRGMTSLIRDDPANGVIEVGSIIYARALQLTPASTEATYLLAKHIFDDLAYRRLEWKLDSLNAASAAAARRLGFVEEGLFRRHMVYKGRSRDTLWFAMIDADWPRAKARLEAWLTPENFDGQGRQRVCLSAR